MGHASLHFDTQRLQMFRYFLRCFELPVRKLGILMDVPAPFDDLVRYGVIIFGQVWALGGNGKPGKE